MELKEVKAILVLGLGIVGLSGVAILTGFAIGRTMKHINSKS